MIGTLIGLAFLQAAAIDPAASASEEVLSSPATPAPCSSEAHAAFDFWIGEWEVAPNGTQRKGTFSTIERVASGCVIREHWKPASGRDGTSMSFLNPATQRWEQVWVGSDGSRVDFVGGMVAGKMVLTGYWRGAGPDGSDVLTRMTYSQLSGGKVRQFGEGSTDHGVSWQTSFDLIYSPKDTE